MSKGQVEKERDWQVYETESNVRLFWNWEVRHIHEQLCVPCWNINLRKHRVILRVKELCVRQPVEQRGTVQLDTFLWRFMMMWEQVKKSRRDKCYYGIDTKWVVLHHEMFLSHSNEHGGEKHPLRLGRGKYSPWWPGWFAKHLTSIAFVQTHGIKINGLKQAVAHSADQCVLWAHKMSFQRCGQQQEKKTLVDA